MADKVVKKMAVDKLVSNQNIREIRDDNSLHELAQSIKTYGLLHPILVDGEEKGKRRIISGHRRFAAVTKILNWKEIDVLHFSDSLESEDMTLLQIAENVHRQELNPVDEAVAFKALTDTKKVKQKDIASMINKTEAYVSQRLSLLKLSPVLQKQVKDGSLPVGKAVEIAKIPVPARQEEIAEGTKDQELAVTREQVARERRPVQGEGSEEPMSGVSSAAKTKPKTIRHRSEIEKRLENLQKDRDENSAEIMKRAKAKKGGVQELKDKELVFTGAIEQLQWVLIIRSHQGSSLPSEAS